MQRPPLVLVASVDPRHGPPLLDLISQFGLGTVEARSVSEAEKAISPDVCLVFCEDCLPEGGYSELLRKTRLNGSRLPIVVSSVSDDPEQYLKAMQSGAYDYVVPPYRASAVELILQRRCEERRPLALPVQIFGVDAAGVPFLQETVTSDISAGGARIGGIVVDLRPGDLIGVMCCEKNATFRIAWSKVREGGAGTREIGIQQMDPGECPWSPMLERALAGQQLPQS